VGAGGSTNAAPGVDGIASITSSAYARRLALSNGAVCKPVILSPPQFGREALDCGAHLDAGSAFFKGNTAAVLCVML